MEATNISTLLKGNTIRRRSRRQTGQRVETANAWFLRYYHEGKRVCVRLADKSEQYRTWQDVEPLIAAELARANGESTAPSSSVTLAAFVEEQYLPWVEKNKSAATHDAYRALWELRWKAHVGNIPFLNLTTADVTRVLTAYAEQGFASRTLGHSKWLLSGVYEFALAQNVVRENPVPSATWLCKVKRTTKPAKYSLEQVLSMLRVLESRDIRAAVAVALAYFTALRPAEIRGLRWSDYDGAELNIQRAIWRGHEGLTKTEGSAATVPVIEPLRGLLERIGTLYGRDGYILQNANHRPLSLDSLNTRVIAPALKKAGIDWSGYYPCRRGISSLVTDSSKNALNSTGLLRHTNPVTALRHYTSAQKDSVTSAMKNIEQRALELMAKQEFSEAAHVEAGGPYKEAQ